MAPSHNYNVIVPPSLVSFWWCLSTASDGADIRKEDDIEIMSKIWPKYEKDDEDRKEDDEEQFPNWEAFERPSVKKLFVR